MSSAGSPLDPPDGGGPLVFAVVGTDHHPFGRMCRWVDDWFARQPPGVRCLIQVGPAPTPQHAASVRSLSYDDVQRTMRSARAVVCHAGPGTVMDCRHAGLLPIVVPRQHDLGEHVDDHQLFFARKFAEAGILRVAETEQKLHVLLDDALAAPERFRVDVDGPAPPGVARFGDVVSLLAAAEPRPRLRLWR